jgi:hypothetical protein
MAKKCYQLSANRDGSELAMHGFELPDFKKLTCPLLIPAVIAFSSAFRSNSTSHCIFLASNSHQVLFMNLKSIFPAALLLLVASLASMVAAPVKIAAEEPVVHFKKQQLDEKFRSEGAAIGDFNHDGQPDIAAGFVWYEAPEWTMHTVLETAPEYQPKGYSNSFCTFAEDLNGDDWDDIIIVDFPGTPTWWFENPQGKAGPWKRHAIAEVTNNESPQMVDLDADGQRELVFAFSPDKSQPDGDQRQMAFAKRTDKATDLWTLYPISEKGAPGTQKYSHGLGIGDVNGDGRSDIVVPQGWWEAPEDISKQQQWTWHETGIGDKGAQMYVFDIDGDGDSDMISSSPHAFGIWWHEQTAPNEWKTHEIDMSYSQTHAVCLADINGDGLPDFVTGKRWWAHGGNDPGADGPSVMCWYELKRKDGAAFWVRHQFDHDSGVGTQFEIGDVNGDGLLDVVTSNKKGVFYFQQSRSGEASE